MSIRIEAWLEKTYRFRAWEKEIIVSRDFWHELQAYIYKNPEFHLCNVQRVNGENNSIYVFGVKVIKGPKL